MATAAAAQSAPALGIVAIPISQIDPHPNNPRKVFRRLEELAQSIKERGVLVPVRLRPHGKRFQLVFGERRWRAAKLAGVSDIPAIVREMSDDEVLELMMIELANDDDVSPLEQAELFKALEARGHTPDDIAAKTGLSKRVVYERLQLCKLGPEGKKALAEERINASVALLIARIPAELQAKAIGDVAASDDKDSPLSYRAAVEHVQQNFMLQLKDAPFDITDAKLVPKAGPCSTCPKRTGNQRELFSDVKSADVCTDPKCYRSKEDALWQLKVKDAEKSGQKVIPDAEAKKLFNSYGGGPELSYNAPYKKLDDEEWVGDKHKSVKALLGKEAPTPVLARSPDGTIVELVPRELVEKKMRELEPERSRSSGDDSQAKFRKQQLLRGKVVTQALGLLVDKAELDEAGRKTLVFIATTLFDGGGYHDGTTRVSKRRGIERDQIAGNISKMTNAGLAGLIVEVLAGQDANMSYSSGYSDTFTDACKTFGIDPKKIEAKIKAEAKAKKAAPRVKKIDSAAAKKPASKKKGGTK